MMEMQQKEILRHLIFELKSAAENYHAEADAFDSQKERSLFELLARRCERFETQIEKAAETALDIVLENGSGDEEKYKAWTAIKEREQIFISIEGRESRLERLYREILRNESIPPAIREILKEQFGVIYKWHNFVITEEVNFIFGSEVKIPTELSEV